MTIAPGAKVGAAGLSNSAHAGYEAWTGHCQTPAAAARVFAANLKLSKVDASGAPLAGAVVANPSRRRVVARRRFLRRRVRAPRARLGRGSARSPRCPCSRTAPTRWSSSPHLRATALPIPPSSSWAYTPARVTSRLTPGPLKPLRVAGVDAESATASLELVNEKAASGWPGFIPQTGDTAWGGSLPPRWSSLAPRFWWPVPAASARGRRGVLLYTGQTRIVLYSAWHIRFGTSLSRRGEIRDGEVHDEWVEAPRRGAGRYRRSGR